jgi:flagellar hook-length control protein FliK
MNNLPINISANIAAKPPTNPAASDEANHPAEQGFNNVLARQVNDASKQTETNRTATDNKKTTAEKDSTSASGTSDDTASAPTADMLATLLTQQNQTATAALDNSPQLTQNSRLDQASQLIQNPQIAQSAQLLQDAQTPRVKQNAHLASTATSPQKNAGKGKPEPMLEAMLAKADTPGKINSKLVAAAKATDLKDLNSAAHNQTLRGSFATELAAATQQPGLPSALTANAPGNPTSIATPITQQPAWGDEFGQKITWMATQNNQTAELHLNPPQLGPLDVSIKMNGDQATATFTSPHAAVREAIEQAMPKLREMLADSGIMLGNAMVSDQPARNNPDHASGKSQGKSHTESVEAVSEGHGIQETRVSRISRHNGMVDTFA